MHLEFIVMASLVVAATLFLAAMFLYSSMRGLRSTRQKELGLQDDRMVSRQTETDCRG